MVISVPSGGRCFTALSLIQSPVSLVYIVLKTKQILGLPWWSSDSESALQCRGLSSICGPGIKIPRGPEQRRPGATTCCAATRDPTRPN